MFFFIGVLNFLRLTVVVGSKRREEEKGKKYKNQRAGKEQALLGGNQFSRSETHTKLDYTIYYLTQTSRKKREIPSGVQTVRPISGVRGDLIRTYDQIQCTVDQKTRR